MSLGAVVCTPASRESEGGHRILHREVQDCRSSVAVRINDHMIYRDPARRYCNSAAGQW